MVDKIEVDGVMHDIQDSATKANVDRLTKILEELRKTVDNIDASSNQELADAVLQLKNNMVALETNVWYLVNVNGDKIAELENKLNEIINDVGDLEEGVDTTDIISRLQNITTQYVTLALRVVAVENRSKDQATQIEVLEKKKPILFSGTYAQVSALTTGTGSLIPGGLYEITDYHATVRADMEGVAVIGDGYTFRLILRAATSSIFDHKVVSIYRNFNPRYANYIEVAWQVWYDIKNDTGKYNWANPNGKGVIYRMIDEKGNDCPYDFKQIVFSVDAVSQINGINGYNGEIEGDPAFFYTFTELQDDNRIVDSTSLYGISNSQNNIISPSFDINGYTLVLQKNIFIDHCSGNKISDNCSGNVIKGSMNVTLERSCTESYIGEGSHDLIVGGNDIKLQGSNTGLVRGSYIQLGRNTHSKILGGVNLIIPEGIYFVFATLAWGVELKIVSGVEVANPIYITTSGDNDPLIVEIPASGDYRDTMPIYITRNNAGDVTLKKLFE